MRNYRGIDLFKIIAAYLIILLHVPVFKSDSIGHMFIRQIVTIVAVPYFFTASGFLLSGKLQAHAIPKSVKTNYTKYLIWLLIYFPIVVFGWLLSPLSIPVSFVYYIRDFFLEGSYLTIWFLNALAFAIIVEWLLLKRFSKTVCFYISIPIFILTCLLSSYNQLFVEFIGGKNVSDFYYLIFSTTKNGLLFGFPFVALGAYTSEFCKKKNMKSTVAAIGMILSFIGLVIEVLLRNTYFPQNKSVDFAIMLLPFSFFSMVFSSEISLKERTSLFSVKTDSDFYSYIRTLSILLF